MRNLRRKVCAALDSAVENFDIDKMYGMKDDERTKLSPSVLDALQCAFNAVFDVRFTLYV